jgi:hypothetical protein
VELPEKETMIYCLWYASERESSLEACSLNSVEMELVRMEKKVLDVSAVEQREY